MPKSSLPLKSVRDSKWFKPIDINSNLYSSLQYALPGTIVFSFTLSLFFRDFPYISQLPAGIIFFFFGYLPNLALVTEFQYRASHRYPCAILLKAIRNKSALSKPLFSYLSFLYRNLGKYTSREDVAALCFVYSEYQKYIEQQTRGKVAQRVKAIANFFPDTNKYHTIRKHFIELADEGQDYIIEGEIEADTSLDE